MNLYLSYLKNAKLPFRFLNPSNLHISVKKSSIDEWRERIFFTVFLIVLLTGTFTFISNVIISIQLKHWVNIAIYTFAYILMIIITFVKLIPFKIRVTFLCSWIDFIVDHWTNRKWTHVAIFFCCISKLAFRLEGRFFCSVPEHNIHSCYRFVNK